MAVDLELLVNPDSYRMRIEELRGYLSSLNLLVGNYENLRAKAVTVFGEEDPNLAKAQNAVAQSIALVNQKIEAVQSSITLLEQTLNSMNEGSTAAGSLLDESAELIAKLLK